jgi:hypothetical protein
MAVTKEVRDEIYAAMEEQGVSQTWVVDEAGITDASLSDILTGKVGSSKYLGKVLFALGIPLWKACPMEPEERAWLELLHELKSKAGEGAVEYRTHRLRDDVRAAIALAQVDGDS